MSSTGNPNHDKAGGTWHRRIVEVRRLYASVLRRAEETLLWKVWGRMLDSQFVDRSVALAGKAFVSFFPLVIVVAAFVPSGVRTSIFTTLTHRLGITGDALATTRRAFASAEDIRRATGLLGLLFTIFYASQFTTALQRVYRAAWRRPPGAMLGIYVRGLVWMGGILGYMALMGALRAFLPGDAGIAFFGVVGLSATAALWWLTAWMMLDGQVRLRVLVPSGLITGVGMSAYAVSATIWMPSTVTGNQRQFGFFGVALALVTWFSGAAICVVVGACAGAVLAEDRGPIGRFVRGSADSLLVDGAPASLVPTGMSRIAGAFASSDDDGSPKSAAAVEPEALDAAAARPTARQPGGRP